MLEVISRALEASPGIRLEQIEWYSAVDPNSDGENDPRRNQVIEGDRIERDPKYTHYHIAEFKGQLQSFSGDYRAAIDQADKLVADLVQHPNVKHAEVVQYPLDVTSGANLSGNATESTADAEAKFTVKVVLGIVNPEVAGDATEQS
jgi:hypothetical protein